MVEYQKNNIIFRIASSDAISKFKSKQAAALLQLTRKDLNFIGGPRESVLLEYDMLSHWIYKIERTCLISGHGPVTNDLKTTIVNSFISECEAMQVVMESHFDTFNHTLTQFTNIIHAYATRMFGTFCDTHLKDIGIQHAFTLISNFISDYLEHFLVSMHELIGNLESKKFIIGKRPSLSSTDFSLDIVDDETGLPTMKRAQFFKHLGCGSFYEFKNYSSINLIEKIARDLSEIEIYLFPEIVADELVTVNK